MSEMHTNAQSFNKVHLIVVPFNSIIRIDSALYQRNPEGLTLTQGNHFIQMWAPGRCLVNDTLNVSGNLVKYYRKKLPKTIEYKNYLWRTKEYFVAKRTMQLIGIPIGYFLTKKFYDSYKTHLSNAGNYLNQANIEKTKVFEAMTFEDIASSRNNFNAYATKYDTEISDANKAYKNSIIVGGGSIVSTIILNYLATRLKKPIYNEVPLLSDYTLRIEQENILVGLSLNLARK